MKVLDIGIEHHFFETLKGLKKDSTACEEYIKIMIMKCCYLNLQQIIVIITNIVWYLYSKPN